MTKNNAAAGLRRKPQSFTPQDLDLLKDTLGIPHESRTLVFEYLAHTHPDHSMKSWHSFYHKKVNNLGQALTAPNPPPEKLEPAEEDALINFLAQGGSFMIDTSPLLYGQTYLRAEASWVKHYHSDKHRIDAEVAIRRGQQPLPQTEHPDGSLLDAMLGPAAALGIDPSVSRYLPNHTLSRGAPELTLHEQQQLEEQHMAYQQQLAEEEARYHQQQQEQEQYENEHHVSASPSDDDPHGYYPPHHHPHGVLPPPPPDGAQYEEDPNAQAYASSSHHDPNAHPYQQADMLDPSLRAHDPTMPTGIPMHDHDELERLEEAEVASRVGPVRTTKRKKAASRDGTASAPGTTKGKGKKKRGAAQAIVDQPDTSATTVGHGMLSQVVEGDGDSLALFTDAGDMAGHEVVALHSDEASGHPDGATEADAAAYTIA